MSALMKINGHTIAERAYGKLPVQREVNGHAKRGSLAQLFAEGKLHPLVEIFPSLKETDEVAFFLMVEDIRRVGSMPPFLAIKSDAWLIIDNRDRFEACKVAGIKIEFCEWSGPDSLAETVARLNRPGAHLSDSQIACVAAMMVPQIAAENSARQTSGLLQGNPRQRNSEIATKTAISENATVGLLKGPRSNGLVLDSKAGERAAAKAANIHHVSRNYVEIALKIQREDVTLFHLVRLGAKQEDGRPLNLLQARIQLHKNLSKKKNSGDEKPTALRATDESIITGDCLKEMEKLPGGKFQLIFADPPYNNGYKYDADPTLDHRSDKDYLRWCKQWMSECARLLAPNGSLFVLIDDNYDDYFGVALREIPTLHRRKKIFWWEEFGQHSKTNFGNAMRVIHYFTRGEKNFIWEPDRIKEPSKRETVYHDSRHKPGGRVPANVWPIPRQVGSKADVVPFDDHPPQLPAMLLERIVSVASNPGDTVFDPFAGNGTTGRAALSLGRKFTGIERSPLYAKQARQWIASGQVPNADFQVPNKSRGGKS